MKRRLKIEIPRVSIESFCKRHGVKKLAFFGSVLRDDFDPGRSDVDVLIEFEPGEESVILDWGRWNWSFPRCLVSMWT